MATEVLMPRQGNTVESCLLVSWKKKPGDTVSAGETICEVETDKATVEVPAPESGTVLRLLVKQGDDVPVLAPIAVIGRPDEKPPEPHSTGATPTTATGTSPAAISGAPASSAPAQASSPPGRAGPSALLIGKPAISPRARRLAQSKGLELDGLTGTGPRGRIIERDVRERLAAAPVAASLRVSPAPTTTIAAAQTIPVRGVRKLTAERMRASLSTTAQLTIHMSADATKLLAFRAELKASPPERALSHIGINDMIMFAAAWALRSFPELNAHFLGDRITQFQEVNLGFAVDTSRGLLVPVIRRADGLSLRAVSSECSRLAAACRDGKATPEDLSGATFTTTNLGAIGVEYFTPVLNPPEVGILGICAIQPKPIQSGTSVEFRPHIGLSLTIDHQAVDGAPAARFLAALCDAVARFDLLLAE